MSMTEKLAYIKKLRHLTTEEIARHSGVPVGTLNKIFSGQTRHPAAEPMARLAQSLRVPIRYLLDDALPLECYISLNGSDGPILLSDEEIRLLMRLRELEPRSRRAMGIMAELLGAPAPCRAGAYRYSQWKAGCRPLSRVMMPYTGEAPPMAPGLNRCTPSSTSWHGRWVWPNRAMDAPELRARRARASRPVFTPYRWPWV